MNPETTHKIMKLSGKENCPHVRSLKVDKCHNHKGLGFRVTL